MAGFPAAPFMSSGASASPASGDQAVDAGQQAQRVEDLLRSLLAEARVTNHLLAAIMLPGGENDNLEDLRRQFAQDDVEYV